jgi:flagellar protein FlaI
MRNRTHCDRLKISQLYRLTLLLNLVNFVFTAWYSTKKVKFNPNATKDKKNLETTYSEITKEIDNFDEPRKKTSPAKQNKSGEKKLHSSKVTTVNSLNQGSNLILESEEIIEDDVPQKTPILASTEQIVPTIDLKPAPPIQQLLEKNHDIEVIDECSGFGYKGLGSRKIVFDKTMKEYLYYIIEPELTEKELELKKKLVYLFKRQAEVDVFDKEREEKLPILENSLDNIVKGNHIKIDESSKDKIFYYITQEFAGFGKIDILMVDEGIEDISCDGHKIPIFIVHKTYESIKTNVIFNDPDTLGSFVVKLAQMAGKQISVYEPIVDGKLTDGSRLQTTLGKTITLSSTFTIRRFREDPLTPVDLIENNTMSAEMAAYFWLAIEKGSSMLFCGGTATGKTTMLNALSLFVPTAFKIVSIEDTREINLPHENWIAGTTRTGFTSSETSKTAKDIDMFDLIRVALRQRPRVIIVGEVRGREAYTLFQAMTTGHLSYSTVHASDMHALIQRLENPPISLPRALLTSLDLIVFLNSVTVAAKPVRRITNVTEVIKLDPETNRLVTMTPFHWVSELDDRFNNNGGSRIMYNLKLQYGWSEKELQKEIQNRIMIMKWLRKKNLRSYSDVGTIVSKYHKDPKTILKLVEEDLK